MPSVSNDLYLASGNVGILNSWTPTVTKFDSSTFYNWEQDNEPIYDLEERTEYLWERVGYPIANGFSGIPGKAFAVSADAPFAGESSGVIFKSLSAVINVLPNPITYPIIIEVASWGNLGELCLKNVKVDKGCNGAGLEIVNINHGRNYKFDAPISYVGGATDSHAGPAGGAASSVLFRIRNAQSFITGAVTTSNTPYFADSRSIYNNRAYSIRVAYGTAVVGNNASYLDVRVDGSAYHADSSGFRASLNSTLNGAGGVYTSLREPAISTFDISTVDADGTTLLSRENKDTGDYHQIFYYGNYLKNIKVENCTGPIYIRNFCVDGGSDNRAGTVTQTEDYGFEITNSDVVLENSFALRCKKAGFKFQNSNIAIRRGILAYRNYEVSNGGQGRYADKKSYGILAENSVLDIQPTSFDSGLSSVDGVDLAFQTSYNAVGLSLINSKLKGGTAASGPTLINKEATVVHSFFNTSCGIELINSEYDHNGITEVFNNYIGMETVNSNVKLPMFVCEFNKHYGLKSDGSVIVLNPKLVKVTANSVYSSSGFGSYTQFTLFKNGQNLYANNSLITFPEENSIPDKFGIFTATQPILVDETTTTVPSININNSTVKLAHAFITSHQDNFENTNALFGACIHADNNSNVKIQGSKSGPNILLGFGSDTVGNVAAVHVNKNSSIEFNGPTLIGETGVDVLAENNSVVKFAPHTNSNGNLDVSGWNLVDNKNHTKVELHAIRACLIADNKSQIIMEHLGDFHDTWGAYSSSVDYNFNNALVTSAYTSKGYMQFFTNGQYNEAIVASAGRYNLPAISYNTIDGYFLVDPYSTNPTTNAEEHLKYSTGGMCVRALHGSDVKVFNVHFPAGWAQADGIWYDASATNCEMLRIWNICDDSTFEAAYCSVSSVYPSLAGYRGPSAVWLSGTGQTANTYPSSTPDTGTLATLDYYGTSGSKAGTNYGPFRLYFSPNSRAKFLTTSASNGVDQGVPYQVLAQGYNPSGACSAVGASAVSGLYDDITSAQFYFVSAMLDPSYFNRIRLDESAANTWANAKHNGIAKSGRFKLVTLYRATASTEPGSQAFTATTAKYGQGLRSAEIFDLRRSN